MGLLVLLHPSPCWHSLNNSETVEAITFAFYRVKWLFLRDIHAEFGILNLIQSPNIGQNPKRMFLISEFLVNFLLKKNCHNCRTSNSVDMKLGPAAKLDKRNTTTLTLRGQDSFTKQQYKIQTKEKWSFSSVINVK